MDKERINMKANRHTSLGLSDEDVLEMYRYMLLARKLDERMWLLNRSGKINFVVSGQGQEAAQIGAGFALDRTKDYIAPYYRDLGLVLYYGMTTKDICYLLSVNMKILILQEDRCQTTSVIKKEKLFRIFSCDYTSTTCSWVCISIENQKRSICYFYNIRRWLNESRRFSRRA